MAVVLLIVWAAPAFTAEQDETFTKWLEDFQAWDVLQDELSRQSSTPKTVLKRAKLLLRLDRPDDALGLLDAAGGFEDAGLEAERMWIKARAYRLQEKPVEALIQYSRAAESMMPDARLETMRSEPDLEAFWKAVWKKWYWDRFTGTHLLANQGQQQLILRAAEQAGAAWPDDPFWGYAADIMRASLERSSQEADQGEASMRLLDLESETASRLATSLAAASIGSLQAAEQVLQPVAPSSLALLWLDLLDRLYTRDGQAGSLRVAEAEQIRRSMKLTAFREWALPAMQSLPQETWRIREPKAASWEAFRKKLLAQDPDKALASLEKELESTLLGQDLKRVLAQYSLAFALLADRFERARGIWSDLDQEQLPLSLRICGLLLGYGRVAEVAGSSEESADTRRVLAFVSEILGPSDFWASHLVAPFWIEPGDEDRLRELERKYPLDRLLSYSLDRRAWSRNQTEALAKRAALLYPESSLRNDGLFFLARQAHQRGAINQAWQYVQEMDPDMLGSESRADYLLAKAGLLMEMGRESKSLAAYKQILSLAPEKLPLEKKLRLALMAQRHGEWDWAQSILQELWAQRESLSTALRAEVMFWMAEGAQKRGNDQKALEKYLKLAWEYPQEHIWAVTALYRSALIYEQQGRLQAARRLLEKVMQRADRESQKKAAQDRIEAIERKMDQGASAPELQYLY